jgi:uracil-DNA glycosylase family 4
MSNFLTPDLNCDLCPRLKAFRDENEQKHPEFFNAPVAPFLSNDAPKLLIVGLAPGLKGANATGRPFTGDYAGDLLYKMLDKYGFSKGNFGASADDGLALVGAGITNAVKCVPPQNKPVGAEMNICRQFLSSELAPLTSVKAILSLGKISHDSVLRALGLRLAAHPFGHAAIHDVENTLCDTPQSLRIFDSYHCSRYNTNTGRLTEQMFENVFVAIKSYL